MPTPSKCKAKTNVIVVFHITQDLVDEYMAKPHSDKTPLGRKPHLDMSPIIYNNS